MKQELEEKLLNEFPDLYKQHNWSMQETCMCWGFEVRDGWFDLIYNLSKKITEIDPSVEAVQVKEKFGGLRFYIGGVDKDNYKEVTKAIEDAEEESYATCESCGTKENVSQNKCGWILTLCNTCRERRKNERSI